MTQIILPAYNADRWDIANNAALLAAQSSGDQTNVTAANWIGNVETTSTMEFPGTHRRTLTGNAVLMTLPAPASSISGTLSIRIFQPTDGPGTYTFTWPSIIKWGYGKLAPTAPTRPGGYIIVHLFWDGSFWSGILMDEY